MSKHLWHATCVICINCYPNTALAPIPLLGAGSGEILFAEFSSVKTVTYKTAASTRLACVEAFERLRFEWVDRLREEYAGAEAITSFTTSYKKVY